MATSSNAPMHSLNSATTTTWQIDPAPSRVEFSLRQRILVARLTVRGRFSDVSGTITFDEQNPANSQVDASIGVASVDTKQSRRDLHLQQAEFFDAARFPRLHFTSDRVEDLDLIRGRARLTGKLTMKGVTREVRLDVEFPSVQESIDGARLRFTGSTVVDGRDFGLSRNNLFVSLGDSVQVTLNIEATRVEPQDRPR